MSFRDILAAIVAALALGLAFIGIKIGGALKIGLRAGGVAEASFGQRQIIQDFGKVATGDGAGAAVFRGAAFTERLAKRSKNFLREIRLA